MTLFAYHPTIFFALLFQIQYILDFYIHLCPKAGPSSFAPTSSLVNLQSRQPPVSSTSTSSNQVQIPPLPALTTYRVHMMLMTILHLGSPCEMRNLWSFYEAGTATSVFSHLTLKFSDGLGVGSFVFLQGFVSAIQPIKNHPAYLTSPVMSKFIRVTRKSLPIISLGLIRVILVKGTDYSVIYSFGFLHTW